MLVYHSAVFIYVLCA